MPCMDKKPPQQKDLKENETFRLDGRKRLIIKKIQEALSDNIRGKLSKTQAVEAALEIAAEKLNVTPKHSA